MKSIKYIVGDATKPVGDGLKIIPHICNSVGAWGSGFVIAISKMWVEPEKEYRAWYKSGDKFALGSTQFVKVEDDIVIANMIGQHGIGFDRVTMEPPIRYDSLRSCLIAVRKLAIKHKASIHAPKFGAGLAGGDWNIIEQIIIEELCSYDIDVTIYNFGVL